MAFLELKAEKESDNIYISQKILEISKNVRIFAFHGELGAGKTTLIKYLCRELGVEETVSSPTFSLVQEYVSAEGSVYHFDFYRINSEIEAYDIGVEEYFDSGSYCFIEWPEKIPTLLPDEAVQINIETIDPHQRRITLTL